MTRFRSYSLNDILVRVGLLLLLSALVLLSVLFTPAQGQSVQAMVKAQPFPYPTGVAMDQGLYGLVKAKLVAADSLRQAASQRIDALTNQLSATETALFDRKQVSLYDSAQVAGLSDERSQLLSQLESEQGRLQAADAAIETILKPLPRRIRITLDEATPDELAQVVVDYTRLLQLRKWKWLGVGTLAGALAGLFFHP